MTLSFKLIEFIIMVGTNRRKDDFSCIKLGPLQSFFGFMDSLLYVVCDKDYLGDISSCAPLQIDR